MALGIWGGVAFVGGIIAAILALLYSTVGLVHTLGVAFIVICLLMMLIILAQKPKGGGLSGAFGGAGGGSTQTAFGAKTGDVMTWATIVLFILFLTVAMGLTWATRPAVETVTPVPSDVIPADATDVTDVITDEEAAPAASTTTGVPSETAATPEASVAPEAAESSEPTP